MQVLKAANTVMLGVIMALGITGLEEKHFQVSSCRDLLQKRGKLIPITTQFWSSICLGKREYLNY
ncbi:MAG: hypothetical protein R2741_08780 [Methanolobus sp.]